MMSRASMPKSIFICGPTGSGKSALALELAKKCHATIINTDSMQVYDGLRILTARPNVKDEKIVPHKLYGFVDPASKFSVGIWRHHAILAASDALRSGRTPIFVGGTGLYFRTLLEGIAPVPTISEDVRKQVQNLFDTLGREEFCNKLSLLDPDGLKRVGSSNTHRLIRLYEVILATGRTLADWQEESEVLLIDPILPAIEFVLSPDRKELYQAINNRAESMVSAGVLIELELFLKREIPISAPIKKAIGFKEFSQHLQGEMLLSDTISKVQINTRHYAKRQMTWFRNQMPNAIVLEDFGPEVFKIVQTTLDKLNQVDPIQSKD